jgi:hypothetical protein
MLESVSSMSQTTGLFGAADAPRRQNEQQRCLATATSGITDTEPFTTSVLTAVRSRV